MNKKLVVLLAVVLALACVFTACNNNKKKPTKTGRESGLTSTSTLVTYGVSETQYQYVTGSDGNVVTVAVTDANGETHFYIQAVKPGAQGVQATEAPATVTVTDAQGEPVMVTNVQGSSVVATETVPAPSGSAPSGNAPSSAQPASTELIPITDNKVVDKFIDILNSGRFSISGKMSADNETIPMSFVKNGNDIRMSAELSGIQMDMASVGGKMYLISNEKKSYIELTDSIMTSLDLDPSDLKLEFGQVTDTNNLVENDGEYNGKAVKTYTSRSPEGSMMFYIDNDDLVKLEMYDTQGRCTTIIEPDQIRGDITAADVAIPKDYEKKSYVSFIADIMGEMENN